MKLTKINSVALALALAATWGLSAHADPQYATYSDGDVLIGFEQSGSSQNYVIDLGSVTQFVNATGTLTFQLSASDLQAAFGSTWASNSQTNLVQWGVIGGTSTTGTLTLGSNTFAKNTVFYTKGEVTPGTQTPPPTQQSGTGQQKTWDINILNNFVNGDTGFNNALETAGSTESLQAINQTASNVNSYSYWVVSHAIGFGIGQNIQQPTSGSATGPTNSALDFYESDPVANQPATYLGNFSLSNTGLLTFNAAAVPEPSTYALVFGGLLSLALIGRLRAKTASVI